MKIYYYFAVFLQYDFPVIFSHRFRIIFANIILQFIKNYNFDSSSNGCDIFLKFFAE